MKKQAEKVVMKEMSTNYVTVVTSKLETLRRQGVHFDLKEMPIEVIKYNEIIYKIYFNGKKITASASTKCLAKKECYKQIFQLL